MTDTHQILKDMARLTALSGKISEVHEKNLQLYPFIFFEAIQECKISYDLSHIQDVTEDLLNDKLIINKPIHNPTVSYYLTLNETKQSPQLNKCFEALERSVRTLLWSNVKIEVYFNGELKFKSK